MNTFYALLPFQRTAVNKVFSMVATTNLLDRVAAMEKDIIGTERNLAKHFATCPKGEACPRFQAGTREIASMRAEQAALIAEISETMTEEN